MAASDRRSPVREKRKNIRHNRSLMTEVFADGAAFLGTIRNESRGGLYVQAIGPFSSGQKVTLTYTTPSGMDMKRAGRIVNLYPEGIGIQFDWPGYNR